MAAINRTAAMMMIARLCPTKHGSIFVNKAGYLVFHHGHHWFRVPD
jgi:hypothetical protein